MTDALVARYVWTEAGIGTEDGEVFVHDFGWRLRLGTREELGVPEAFDP